MGSAALGGQADPWEPQIPGRKTKPGGMAGGVGPTGQQNPWDLQAPGTYENYWQNQGGFFTSPTASSGIAQKLAPTLGGATPAEQYWASVQGRLSAPTSSEQYYSGFAGRRPEVGLEAGLDPYYERARERTGQDIDRAMAARGGFGSSAAMDTLSDAFVGLNAEQANREADYRLRALGEMRGWEGLGGALAGGADAAGRGNLALGGGLAATAGQQGLARAGMLADLFGAADAAELARRTTGLTGAAGAQSARQGRIGQAFDAVSGRDAALAQLVNSGLAGIIMNDQELMDAYLSFMVGGPSEAYAQDRADAQKLTGDIGTAFGAFGNVAQGGRDLGWWGEQGG